MINDVIGEERVLGEAPLSENRCNNKSTLSRMRLWILTFTIKSTLCKGCAVVKAHDANRALRLLKSGGMYNSLPSDYEVERIEEIIESPDQMLICEEINNGFIQCR